MNFEESKEHWKASHNQPPDTMPFARQLERVRLDARTFNRTIVWRDAREIAAAVLVATIFVWIGQSAPALTTASAYLIAIASLGVALFLVIDRTTQRRKLAALPDTPLAEIHRALAQVEHQILLLRRVIWWYLLPLAVPVFLFAVAVGVESPMPWPVPAVLLGGCTLIAFAGIWKLNTWVVKKDLAPRRESLLLQLRDWEETAESG